MNYISFDLYIERSGEKYRARVNSPCGEADCEFAAPITEQELKIFRLKTTRARPDLRRSEPDELRGAREFGQKLFNAVFVGEVNGCLVRSLQKIKPSETGLRLRIRLSKAPELGNLPWEYLYESSTGQFLALSKDTPVVRYLDLPVEPRSLAVKPPVRMLVVISSPKDQVKLDVAREWKKLGDGLAWLTATGLVILDKLERPSFSSLMKRLDKAQYHVLHFVGHGQYDKDHDKGVLLFEDEECNSEPITAQALGVLVHDAPSLRLVVLNSCEGAISDSTDMLSGTAQNLIQQGVPAVIAMQSEISEGGAQSFSETFYEAIATGAPVDAALAAARKVLFGALSSEWGSPVLYMRSPDGRLFEAGRPTYEPNAGATATVLPTKEIDSYRVYEEIGHGGSARVYSARRADGPLIALKIFDLGKRSGTAAMINDFFKNELAVVRSLDHPNIVKYLDWGISNGVPFIAMELLGGGSLEDRIRSGNFLAVDDVINIVTPVAAALDYARERHVLHRDIKPSNILFADDDRPVLSDFGIARFAPPREATTAKGTGPPGTSDFMAPEVMLEAPATPASDIYSLGMTVYYSLCADLPTNGKTPYTRSRDRVEGKLVPLTERNPTIPNSVAAAVLRALSPNPRERFATARAFASALMVASTEKVGSDTP